MAKAEQDRGMRIQGYLGALTRPGTRGNLGDEKVRNKLREESRNPSKAARLYPLRQGFRLRRIRDRTLSAPYPSAPPLEHGRSDWGSGFTLMANGRFDERRSCRRAAVL